ncbi:MAG: PKD domain-containing protein, partial [Bacteroidota bacterium]
MTKIYKLTIFLLILLTSMVQAAIAQSTTVYAMGDQRNISSCNGFFTDSGGRLGNYSPNEDLSTLICPNPGSFRGTHVKLSFSEIDLGTDDIDDIAFYDGRDETAPLLSMASEFLGQTPFVIQATAANTTGCIYVVFTSNQNNEGAGWLAKMSCVPACQQIEAVLVSSDPAVSPVDTGYIDVCPGERIQLTAEGRYPQSGITYEHSDLNATFEWDLGDGTIAYGPTITHAYAESGGYVIQLTITDQFGCTNTNFINQRVRVSPLPTFNIGGVLDSEICVNDTISLTANTTRLDPDRNISVRTNEGSFFLEAARSDSLGLPDGTGISYKTAIELVNFSPAQTLE